MLREKIKGHVSEVFEAELRRSYPGLFDDDGGHKEEYVPLSLCVYRPSY
jgi:hypothetical protein